MNLSHHATLIYSDILDDVLELEDDYFELHDGFYDKFGIDDARSLISLANSTPVNKDFKLLVVRTKFITHEAQNSLLKILEEPPQTTKFLFMVPPGFQFLSTLNSRFSIDTEFSSNKAQPNPNNVFNDFLKMSLKERLDKIDSELKAKNLDWQQAIKQGLIETVSTGKLKAINEIEFVARNLLTRGASNKLLLEHLALLLPVK